MEEKTIVRQNLMTVKGYTPYCGNDACLFRAPRTTFDGSQFICGCGWVSQLPKEFIIRYKTKWSL
jgi:hypothetical protein